MQSNLSLLTVPPDSLLVRLLTVAYDHVIERPLRARAPVRRLVESRPSVPQSARGEWFAWRLATFRRQIDVCIDNVIIMTKVMSAPD